MMAKTILKVAYKHGQRHWEKVVKENPLELTENKGRHGLGYKLTWADRKKMFKGRK